MKDNILRVFGLPIAVIIIPMAWYEWKINRGWVDFIMFTLGAILIFVVNWHIQTNKK